jgi:hypothetical protein
MMQLRNNNPIWSAPIRGHTMRVRIAGLGEARSNHAVAGIYLFNNAGQFNTTVMAGGDNLIRAETGAWSQGQSLRIIRSG